MNHHVSVGGGKAENSKEKKRTTVSVFWTALEDIESLEKLSSNINNELGPLIFLDFAFLVVNICALSILTMKYGFNKEMEGINGLLFVGNLLAFLFRLLILIYFLGNLEPQSIAVNDTLTRAFVAQSRGVESALASSILAHLTMYSANPMVFTAWQFFPVSRATLLATVSVISTYAVIILHNNN